VVVLPGISANLRIAEICFDLAIDVRPMSSGPSIRRYQQQVSKTLSQVDGTQTCSPPKVEQGTKTANSPCSCSQPQPNQESRNTNHAISYTSDLLLSGEGWTLIERQGGDLKACLLLYKSLFVELRSQKEPESS
jgi:hypothetical protein